MGSSFFLPPAPQVWRFQRAQAELLLASHHHAARRHREAMEAAKRELGVKER